MVIIEQARTAEQLGRAAYLMRSFSEWAMAAFHADDGVPPNALRKLESELADLPGRFSPPDGILLIAKLDGETVGCLGGAPKDDASIEAARLWVDPSARGHNIGAMLIKQLIQHAKTRGFKSIILRSHKDMASAHALYHAAGFTEDLTHQTFDTLQPFELAMVLPLTK